MEITAADARQSQATNLKRIRLKHGATAILSQNILFCAYGGLSLQSNLKFLTIKIDSNETHVTPERKIEAPVPSPILPIKLGLLSHPLLVFFLVANTLEALMGAGHFSVTQGSALPV